MKYLLTIILCLNYYLSIGQVEYNDSTLISNVLSQGNKMANELLAKNYEVFAKYTYKPIIDMTGSEEKLIELIKKGIEDMEAEGFFFTKCSIEKPNNIIHLKEELQCTVLETIEMKTPKGRMVTKSTLIGISIDNGQNWTFIDTQSKDLKKLQEILPNLSDELIIPKKERPIVYND